LSAQLVARRQGYCRAISMAGPGKVLKKKIDRKREYPI
jgi:hypothetical protein